MGTAEDHDALLERVRTLCLQLPEVTEKETWETPTFRVRDKIVVGIGMGDDALDFAPAELGNEIGTGQPVLSATMKSTKDDQAALLQRGLPFFKPRYVGHNGWIGVVIDGATDWDELEELIMDSYCLIAPKKLSKQLIIDLEHDFD